MTLIESSFFREIITGIVPNDKIYTFRKPKVQINKIKMNLNFNDSINTVFNLIPSSLINPLPMDYYFMTVFNNNADNFNNLFVPFRCIVADVYNKKEIAMDSGDLALAVRASMAFPFVFHPVKWGKEILHDGGIYNNFPVDVMMNTFNPDIIIGSTVSDNPARPHEKNIIGQMENMVMHKTDYTVNPDSGILIRFKFRDISLLDFDKARSLYALGYGKTLEYMPVIKERITSRTSKEFVSLRRAQFRSTIADIDFDSITVTGVRKHQKEYVKRYFRDCKDIDSFTDQYYKFISDDNVRQFIPRAVYCKESERYNINIDAKFKTPFSVSVGGFISSSNANAITLGTQYRLYRKNLYEFNLVGNLGTFNNSLLANIHTEFANIPNFYLSTSYILQQLQYYEDTKLFESSDGPCFIDKTESFVNLEAGLSLNKNLISVLSASYSYLSDKYIPTPYVDKYPIQKDHRWYKLFKYKFALNYGIAPDIIYPNSGYYGVASASFIHGFQYHKINHNPEGESYVQSRRKNYYQTNLYFEKYAKISNHFITGLKLDCCISDQPLNDNYTATIVQMPEFSPTPHSKITFNERFHSPMFLAGGIIPIWKLNKSLNWRNEFYLFAPIKPIGDNNDVPYFKKAFNRIEWMGESTFVFDIKFATIGIFVNKYSYPAASWNIGINLGFLMFAPRF